MKHGGARPGAGRPPIDPREKKELVAVRLPAWLIGWLDKQDESRAVVIEKALVKAFKARR